MRGGLETRIREKISSDDCVIGWMLNHACAASNRYLAHTDGKTAHRKLRRKELRRRITEFGETVHDLPLNTKGKNKDKPYL